MASGDLGKNDNFRIIYVDSKMAHSHNTNFSAEPLLEFPIDFEKFGAPASDLVKMKYFFIKTFFMKHFFRIFM